MESYMKSAGSFLNYQLTVQDKKTWIKVEKKITPLENYSADICWQIIFI